MGSQQKLSEFECRPQFPQIGFRIAPLIDWEETKSYLKESKTIKVMLHHELSVWFSATKP